MELNKSNLPANWQLRRVGEVYTFTTKPRGLKIRKDESVPFLPMEVIPIGRQFVTPSERRPASQLTSGTYFESGDLLVAKITPSFENGKQAVAELDQPYGFATTEVIPLQPKTGISDRFFLYYFLLDPEVRSDLTGKMDGTTGRQRLSKAVLGSCIIPLPPISEQKKIVTVLTLVQRALEAHDEAIVRTTELKKSLMQKLFSEGLRGERRRQTPLGLVPQNWQVVKLAEAVEQIDYGISAPIPKILPEHGVKIVSTADITKDGRLLYEKIRKITAPEKTISRLTLQTGDVLFNWRNSAELIGKSAVFQEQDEPHVFASFILRIKCGEKKSHNYFIAHLMNYFREQGVFVKLARRAVNQANYNRNEISVLTIPLPSIDEQREIANAIEVVDAKIDLHRRKRAAISALFRTLLHQLMTAQIRVNDLKLPKHA